MEHIEKFTELFEGTLDEAAETSLFAELASDSLLRTDFKCFIALNEAAGKNAEAFAPSAAVKSRIFEKAGYKIPGEPVGIPAPVQSAKIPFFKGRLFTGIMTGFIAFVTSILIMMMFFEPKGDGIKSSIKSDHQEKVVAEKIIPKTESNALPITPQKPIIIYKTVYLTKENRGNEAISENALNESRRDTENHQSPQALEFYEQPIQTERFSLNNIVQQNSLITANSIPSYALNPENSLQGKSLDLSIEMKGNTQWSLPKETIFPVQTSRFNNLDFSLLYNFSAHFKAGIHIRQETFYVEYTHTDSIGSLYRYREQPNFTSFGINGKYYPFDWARILPFGQGQLGINRGGFIFRGAFGLEYRFYPDLSLIFGFEYSRFMFIHQNSWNGADKVGVNYGVSYQF